MSSNLGINMNQVVFTVYQVPVINSFSFIKFTFQLNNSYQVGGFTVGDLLDKPWSRVSPRLPPGTLGSLASMISSRRIRA